MGSARKQYTAELVIDGARKAVAFTRRQVQLLRLRATGLGTWQASRELGISYHTAKHHLEHARARAGGVTTTELISQLTSAGLIPDQRPERSPSMGGEPPGHDRDLREAAAVRTVQPSVKGQRIAGR